MEGPNELSTDKHFEDLVNLLHAQQGFSNISRFLVSSYTGKRL